MKSIISNDRHCHICGTTYDLDKHHIFFGRNRKMSEKHGCWCYLCKKHHNWSNDSAHFNHDMDLALKQECQTIFEEQNSHEEFMEIFKKNYL